MTQELLMTVSGHFMLENILPYTLRLSSNRVCSGVCHEQTSLIKLAICTTDPLAIVSNAPPTSTSEIQ